MAIVSVASSSASSMERLSYDRSLLRSTTESYSPLERAIKYSNSKVVLQRLVLIREFIDICHDVGYSKATSTLLPILGRLIRDNDEDVRRGVLSILGDLVGFLVQSDLDKGYNVVLSNIVPIIKEVLMGDIQHTSISVKEMACRVGITLCSHLRHSDRVHSILSISLALANDLENEDSRCLASWMLNGLAEYMGKDICMQFIVPQIKCLADDHSERVRMFATMNLCEVIRITQSFSELFAVFKRLILQDSKVVRSYAVKVIIGIFSGIKTIDNSDFSAFLVEILRDLSDKDLIIDLNKQIGPLITLFRDPDCVPREILDLYLAMGTASEVDEDLSLSEMDSKTSRIGEESQPYDKSATEEHDQTSKSHTQGSNSRKSSEAIETKEEHEEISLLPFGSNLGLTFGEPELNEPSYFCSYSFASVFSHIGPSYWPEFSKLLARLVESPHYSVRLPIAASMSLILATALSCGNRSHSHFIRSNSLVQNPPSSDTSSISISSKSDKEKCEKSSAEIKKEQEFCNTIEKGVDMFFNNIHQGPAKCMLTGSSFKLPCSNGCHLRTDVLSFLHDIIGKLLDDSDIYVKRAIFGCLSDIIRCLPHKEHVEPVIKKFPDLLNSCRIDWRCRNILANQIRKICIELHFRNTEIRRQSETSQELFTGRFAQEYLSPVAFSLLLDPVSEVRKTAINSVSSLLRISSPFLWHFFQNGGNFNDLPSPIHSPESISCPKKDTQVISSVSTSSASTSVSSPSPSSKPIDASCSMTVVNVTGNGGYFGSKRDSRDRFSTINSSEKHIKEAKDQIYKSFQPLYIHKQSSSVMYSSTCNFSPSSSKSRINGNGEITGSASNPGVICGVVNGFIKNGNCNQVQATNITLNEVGSKFPEKLRILFSLDEENGNCKLFNELALIWCILKTFAISTKYHHRQEFIQMCDRFIRDIPRGFFYTYFLNPLILLASDPVRNVRSTWLRVIGPHIKDSGRLAQCANIVAACKLMSLSELDKECNKYLSNIKFLPKSTLKRVDFLSVKDITEIIGRTASYDDILNWNQQPLIKHFNLYMEEVLGSLWCLDNVPGSSLQAFSNTNSTSRKPFYSSERCSDLTMEYEMMLLEVRPNSSPTNISSLAPVITSDTSSLEFGPSNDDLFSNSTALFSCRPGISRRSSEFSENDSLLPNTSLDTVKPSSDENSSEILELDSSSSSYSVNSLEILYRPGIPRSYSKFICPSGTDNSFQNITEPETIVKIRRIPRKKTQRNHSRKLKQDQQLSMVFDHKLHEATRNFFMVDIARAATDDLF
ncbi:phosphatase 2A 65K regulatory chain-like with HEAT repeats [Cryptosporidium sp. chipmunk genotype I]|uniref:phosphatase 2A 65K regulatory chain-like with HEAT repeats n=1 Tax=Cryptosporidium sp. chipmunk genotype I TaxID=1280935 RepID=UPI00351A0810|nr:phosphatase 2A 65K regulatory chain-like with HEAT repeats [Cryptosporidium sp. chipmunk genotype I]